MRETLGNANQNKTSRAEHKKVSGKKKKEAFTIKGALSNAKQNKKTSNNSHIEEGQRKRPKMTVKLQRSPMKNHSEKNRALQNAKKDNKTTKKKSSDRRMPS